MTKLRTIIASVILLSIVGPVQGARVKRARAASVPNLHVSVLTICEGTNYYSPKAQKTYDIYYISDVRPSRSISAERLITLMDEKWSFNRPRDTWRCTKFDSEISWNEHHRYLQEHGYMGYIYDNDILNEAVRLGA